tara:strand:- start:832 stop:1449 length:618 start_codon:yes stop_codon:yes gene_type:complete
LIVIVDYGLGNLQSVLNMLKKIGIHAIISNRPDDLFSAEKLILPGVGSFATGIKNINEMGLLSPLEETVLREKKPILGICLGMQLFAKHSEEGGCAGLGWIDAEIKKFNPQDYPHLKVPNMGWRRVESRPDGEVLFKGMSDLKKFYFVHSYHMHCAHDADIAATSQYGIDYVASVAHDNIYGVQFHPEKSHRHGMQLLKNFCEMS